VDSRDIGERRDGAIGTAAPRHEALKRLIINRCGRRVVVGNHTSSVSFTITGSDLLSGNFRVAIAARSEPLVCGFRNTDVQQTSGGSPVAWCARCVAAFFLNPDRRQTMQKGTVKWFNPTKGYGFIKPMIGDKDVFVHISAVERAGLSTLNEDQVIEYDLVDNRGKSSAENLKVS